MKTRVRWPCLSLLVVIIGLAVLPAAQPVRAASAVQTTHVVERWRGKLTVQGSLAATLISFGTLPGTMRESYTIDFDLKVYEGGLVNGDVMATFSSLSFEQLDNMCGFILKCRVGVALENTVARTFVVGERRLTAIRTAGAPSEERDRDQPWELHHLDLNRLLLQHSHRRPLRGCVACSTIRDHALSARAPTNCRADQAEPQVQCSRLHIRAR